MFNSRGNSLIDDMFNSLYDDFWPPSHWGYGSFLPLYPGLANEQSESSGGNRGPNRSREWHKTLDLQGFAPENVKVDVDNGQVIVNATRFEGEESLGFDKTEARRVVQIPDDVDPSSVRTAMDKRGRVSVIGLRKQPEGRNNQQVAQRQGDFWPTAMNWPTWEDNMAIVDDEATGGKQFKMTYDVSGYKPDEIKVKHTGNHVCVEAEHKEEGEGRYVHRQFHRTHHLPRGYQADQMTSSLNNDGQLVISAPISDSAIAGQERNLPIEMEES